jgi:DNA-binding transcriptional LysR family regulator
VTLDVKAAEVFVAVAEELHFGRAAARVHMTQPAVSRHVSKLEATLGVGLLHRSNRHVELTPEGRIFLAAARDALAAARRAVDAAQRASRGEAGEIRIGSAGTLPNELAWQLVRAFRRRHPAVEVRLSQFGYQSRPLAGIESHEADVALVRAPLAMAGLSFEPLVHEERVAVLGVAHPLARTRPLTLQEFADEPVVTVTAWPKRLRDHWAGVDDGADPGYQVGAVVNGLGDWLGALADRRGVSLCPASIAGYYERADLAFAPIAGVGHSTIGLAWRLDFDGPLLRKFRTCACEHLAGRAHGCWTAIAGGRSQPLVAAGAG